MALNIKNIEVERLASELARASGLSKTEVIRRALRSQRDSVWPGAAADEAVARILEELEATTWSRLTAAELGAGPSPTEQAELLGIADDGLPT